MMIQTSHPERGKLTKTFFMSLPDGTFLVSRARDGANEPMFAEAAVHRAERDEQWRRVRSANACGRLCYVFDSRQHFEEFYKAFPTYGLTGNEKAIRLLETFLETSKAEDSEGKMIEDLLRGYVEGK